MFLIFTFPYLNVTKTLRTIAKVLRNLKSTFLSVTCSTSLIKIEMSLNGALINIILRKVNSIQFVDSSKPVNLCSKERGTNKADVPLNWIKDNINYTSFNLYLNVRLKTRGIRETQIHKSIEQCSLHFL